MKRGTSFSVAAENASYESGDEEIACVNTEGLVIAKKRGEVNIRIKSGVRVSKQKVTVVANGKKKKAQAYEKKVMQQIYTGKALCIGTNWHDCERAETALAYRKGSCSYLTPMFNILCNQAGVEAYIVDGFYVNRDKSKAYHNWSFVKLGKKYYWYDVPVACQNKSAKNVWYKKGTKFWKTCHQWNKRATKGYAGAAFKK